MKHTIFIDGQYIKVASHAIEAFTPGVFKGRGVFETMLAVGGHVLDEQLHRQRLQRGLQALRITPPQLPRFLFQNLIAYNRRPYVRLRLLVWQEKATAHAAAMALPYHPSEKTFRVCLVPTNRPAISRWAEVKSLDYNLFANAYAQAQAAGFDEALLLNCRGHIFEASRANVFWVQSGILYTPPLSSGCLNGITRRQIIRQARHLGSPVCEKNLIPEALGQAQGVFLTNSLMGLKSVNLSIPPLPRAR